jgi:8-oxo-dGTP diphosphatase
VRRPAEATTHTICWMADLEKAAGGVVVRDGLIALVHRPKYDDWSLPKGHLDDGETWEEAALREVEEELGIRARTVRALEPVRYRTRKGRDKEVRYWLMEPVSGEFTPNDEVDDVRWLAPDEARSALSYEADRALIENI